MDEEVAFENYLYGDGKKIVISNIDFCVDRIVMLPALRPLQLERAVNLSIELCQVTDFRRKLLEKYSECPVLMFRLYKQGIFSFESIKPFFHEVDAFMLCFYFRKEIKDFDQFIKINHGCSNIDSFFRSKYIPQTLSLFEKEKIIDQFVEFGFIPSSIEYYLKYDDIDAFLNIDFFDQNAQWSRFEWSAKPKYLDLLSFSGFFGSIRCFKHLLMKGFEINDNVTYMIVCSGCLDLYHLCQGDLLFSPKCVIMASGFCHLSLFAFMIENGANINSFTEKVDFS